MASIPIVIALEIISNKNLLIDHFWVHKTWDELGQEDPEVEKKMYWKLSMREMPFDDISQPIALRNYYLYGR